MREKMKKIILAVIGFAIIAILLATIAFNISGTNETTNATLRADSLQLQITNTLNAIVGNSYNYVADFNYFPNETDFNLQMQEFKANNQLNYTLTFTQVSESTFMQEVTNYMNMIESNEGNGHLAIDRCGNTFYAYFDDYLNVINVSEQNFAIKCNP